MRPREENSAVHDQIKHIVESYGHGSPPAEVTRSRYARDPHPERDPELSTEWIPAMQRGRVMIESLNQIEEQIYRIDRAPFARVFIRNLIRAAREARQERIHGESFTRLRETLRGANFQDGRTRILIRCRRSNHREKPIFIAPHPIAAALDRDAHQTLIERRYPCAFSYCCLFTHADFLN